MKIIIDTETHTVAGCTTDENFTPSQGQAVIESTEFTIEDCRLMKYEAATKTVSLMTEAEYEARPKVVLPKE